MTNVADAWSRIAIWYARNVPPEHFGLAAGASLEQIEELEAELGLEMPDDVRESYRLHNGSDGHAVFEYGFHLLSLEGISQQWNMWREHVESGLYDSVVTHPEGPIRKVQWNVKWIPLTHNAGGSHDCVDMDPDVGGTVGQVIKFAREVGPQRVRARNFAERLGQFAEDLENGRYQFDELEQWLIPPA